MVAREKTLRQSRKSSPKIDVLPQAIIQVHETVKLWATELLSRVQEYLGSYLADYVKTKRSNRVRVRPMTKAELEMLYDQRRRERELRAGAPTNSQRIED
jgi:hypothetical protein